MDKINMGNYIIETDLTGKNLSRLKESIHYILSQVTELSTECDTVDEVIEVILNTCVVPTVDKYFMSSEEGMIRLKISNHALVYINVAPYLRESKIKRILE